MIEWLVDVDSIVIVERPSNFCSFLFFRASAVREPWLHRPHWPHKAPLCALPSSILVGLEQLKDNWCKELPLKNYKGFWKLSFILSDFYFKDLFFLK